MADRKQEWETLKMAGLRERLLEVKTLLQQAAAVGLAQDTARLELAAEFEEDADPSGHHKRRRYR